MRQKTMINMIRIVCLGQKHGTICLLLQREIRKIAGGRHEYKWLDTCWPAAVQSDVDRTAVPYPASPRRPFFVLSCLTHLLPCSIPSLAQGPC